MSDPRDDLYRDSEIDGLWRIRLSDLLACKTCGAVVGPHLGELHLSSHSDGIELEWLIEPPTQS